MCYDYEISYKKGRDNVVANALSRIPEAEVLTLTLSSQHGALLDEIRSSWDRDSQLQAVIKKIEAGQPSPFMWKHGLLLKNGKLVVGNDETLLLEILKTFHASSIAGHSGVHATMKRASNFFVWNYMRVYPHPKGLRLSW